MIYVQILLAVVGVSVSMAYACRMNAMRWHVHRATVMWLHICLGLLALGCGVSAWFGYIGIELLVGLAASVLWLIISWPTWHDGPPEHVTRPALLGVAELSHVSGGTKPPHDRDWFY